MQLHYSNLYINRLSFGFCGFEFKINYSYLATKMKTTVTITIPIKFTVEFYVFFLTNLRMLQKLLKKK